MPEKKDPMMRLGSAVRALEKALEKPVDPDRMNIDATIQRFEFVIELFWKVMKIMLSHEKVPTGTPRDVLQKAYRFFWIDNEQLWLAMLDDRNETSHTYDEEIADAIYARIRTYYPEIEKNYNNLCNKYQLPAK